MKKHKFCSAWGGFSLDCPRVMAILNMTPDSFSEGGRNFGTEAAICAGMRMVQEGADIVDVGGESTRPGAAPVKPEEEQARVLPVIAALAKAGIAVSVDTRNAETMRTTLDAGARIVNDISGLMHDRNAATLIAARQCPVVLMHMRGTPQTMNSLAHYTDVVTEVRQELAARVAIAIAAGIRRENIVLDPGFGFAKMAPHSLALLRGLEALAEDGFPLLVGVSRKSFVGHLSREPDPSSRLGGSIAAALFAISRGASILRVHDVKETVQAIRVWKKLSG